MTSSTPMARPIPAASPPGAVLEHIRPGTDLIVPVANGEPPAILDAVEAGADGLDDVRVHQLLALRARAHHDGRWPQLRHVSYFLSAALREPYATGAVDLVPNDFHSIPDILRRTTRHPLIVAAVSPPDRHGCVSLSLAGDYTAALLDEVPVFAQVNPRLPRTFGRHTFHLADAVGWCEADTDLVELVSPPATEVDRTIAGFVAERIPDGSTLQIGIGSVPDTVAALLVDSRDLGIHSELLGDGLMALMEGGAVNGAAKQYERGKAVTTNIIGSHELYRFADEHPDIEIWPVDLSNDPRMIGRHRRMVAVNATMQVDLFGQCASESLGTHYISSSGGQADFMRGAMLAEDGQNFMVLHSTANTPDGVVSRIVPTLTPGSMVTTMKNAIDKVVTEYGVAELYGATAEQRAERLIAIAHPDFRDELSATARADGLLR
jgi:acyl-CoA hydrolase